MRKVKVAIVGSGPAGYTAAIYAARANLEPVCFAGYQAGGQLMLTTDIDNFPGFPDGIPGPELMTRMEAQARKYGAEIIKEDVTRVDFTQYPFLISASRETLQAESVIIATGANARELGLPGEHELIGRGLSTCAVCDGFFYKGKKVAVIGGGDSALEEATFLTKFADLVTVVHRRDKLRASKIMQDRAFHNEKISFLWNTIIDAYLGDKELIGLSVRDAVTGEKKELKFDGVFLGIGHVPSTTIFKGVLAQDAEGYLIAEAGTKSAIPGIFIAGDVQDKVYRQAITAAGLGCQAALDCEKWLEARNAS
jgi:thioredoxin reductase (NADPH)